MKNKTGKCSHTFRFKVSQYPTSFPKHLSINKHSLQKYEKYFVRGFFYPL